MKIHAFRKTLLLLLTALPCLTQGSGLYPYLKQEGYESLGLSVTTENCTFTEKELAGAAEAEFFRARVKPITKLHFHLSVKVQCTPISIANKTKGFAVSTTIGFSRISESHFIYNYDQPNLHAIDIYPVGSTREYVKDMQEGVSAMLLYLKENI